MENTTVTPGGSLKISGAVIARIALLAAGETPGVKLRQKKSGRGARVKVILMNEAAIIDLPIYVLPGFKCVAAAAAVQREVKQAVQSMTGVAVAKVNVSITGSGARRSHSRKTANSKTAGGGVAQ